MTPDFKHSFNIGDTVTFLRHSVDYGNKWLTGVIVSFNYTEDMARNRYPTAQIQADCEYGSALPYNHSIHLQCLKPITTKNK